jgi:hypothetical protein
MQHDYITSLAYALSQTCGNEYNWNNYDVVYDINKTSLHLSTLDDIING